MSIELNSFYVTGIDGMYTKMEIDMHYGIPSVNIVGLADNAIKESRERIASAIINSDYTFPQKKIVINLAPGDTKKRGSSFDIAMAVGLLIISDQVNIDKNISEIGFIGELSLSGKLSKVKGMISMIIKAKEIGLKEIIVPYENYPESILVEGINVVPVSSLKDVINYLERNERIIYEDVLREYLKIPDHLNFSDIIGQSEIIKYVTIAVAGGHNILMIGHPGSGKSMIAKRIPSILPKMTLNESLEVTKIYSLYEGNGNNFLVTERPFRMPHHNVSMNAMIGGGRNATPGEITLAHNGVLFLDELPQFDKRTLEALRQPVEDGKVTISRVEENHDYPSKFMLVAAMNPCPCGYYGDQKCTCSINDVKNYRKRISGPIIERLDIQKYVNTVNILSSTEKQTDSSEEIKIKIMNTRIIQEERFKNLEGISVNSQIPDSLIKEYCRLDKESTQILVNIQKKFKYSARSINKILKIARTHADFNQRKDIIADDVIFAISARDMDHEYL